MCQTHSFKNTAFGALALLPGPIRWSHSQAHLIGQPATAPLTADLAGFA